MNINAENKPVSVSLPAHSASSQSAFQLQDNRPRSVLQKNQGEVLANAIVPSGEKIIQRVVEGDLTREQWRKVNSKAFMKFAREYKYAGNGNAYFTWLKNRRHEVIIKEIAEFDESVARAGAGAEDAEPVHAAAAAFVPVPQIDREKTAEGERLSQPDRAGPAFAAMDRLSPEPEFSEGAAASKHVEHRYGGAGSGAAAAASKESEAILILHELGAVLRKLGIEARIDKHAGFLKSLTSRHIASLRSENKASWQEVSGHLGLGYDSMKAGSPGAGINTKMWFETMEALVRQLHVIAEMPIGGRPHAELQRIGNFLSHPESCNFKNMTSAAAALQIANSIVEQEGGAAAAHAAPALDADEGAEEEAAAAPAVDTEMDTAMRKVSKAAMVTKEIPDTVFRDHAQMRAIAGIMVAEKLDAKQAYERFLESGEVKGKAPASVAQKDVDED